MPVRLVSVAPPSFEKNESPDVAAGGEVLRPMSGGWPEEQRAEVMVLPDESLNAVERARQIDRRGAIGVETPVVSTASEKSGTVDASITMVSKSVLSLPAPWC
jgi:hypothetical protein